MFCTDLNGKNNNLQKFLAIGLAGKCLIYSITRASPEEKAAPKSEGLRKRKRGDVNKKKGGNVTDDTSRMDSYTFKLLHTLETDFSTDPMQVSACLCHLGRLNDTELTA